MFKYISTFFLILFAVSMISVMAYLQGFATFTFAWVLNLMLMMGVSSLVETFKPGLTSPYYDVKAWESNGSIYKWFGVNAFRKLMVWVGWEKMRRAVSPVKKDIKALKLLEYNTRHSELGHLVIFFIVLGFTFLVAFRHGFKESLWLISLNVILNVYPILVQRYNRPRFQKAIQAGEKLVTDHRKATQ